MFEAVGAVESFPERVPVAVEVGGRELAVVSWGGELYAVRNVCPHQSQSFVGGQVRHEFCPTGVAGEIELGDDEPVIVCPWHIWEFRLRDGTCSRDPSKRVKSYPVEVREGSVYVDVDPARAAAAV